MIFTGSSTLAPLIYCMTCSALRYAALSKKATRTLHFVSSRKHSLIGRTQMFTTVALVATEVGKRSFIKIATSAVATKRSNPSMQLTAHIYLFS